MSIGLPSPVFGGRLLHRTVFESSTNSEGTTVVPFSVIESAAGFTETHQAGLLRLDMPSASTAGAYNDMILYRPQRFANYAKGWSVECLLLFTSIAGAGTEQFIEIGMCGEARETARDQNYYLVECHYQGNELRLWQCVGGSFLNLANATGMGFTAADWYLRTAILPFGRRMFARAWAAANPEPTTWQIEYTDIASTPLPPQIGSYHFMFNGGNDGATTFTQDVKEFYVWEMAAPLECRRGGM